jgi:hypothetical protein
MPNPLEYARPNPPERKHRDWLVVVPAAMLIIAAGYLFLLMAFISVKDEAIPQNVGILVCAGVSLLLEVLSLRKIVAALAVQTAGLLVLVVITALITDRSIQLGILFWLVPITAAHLRWLFVLVEQKRGPDSN